MNTDQLLAHFQKLRSTLKPSQMAALGGVFVAVVTLVVGSAYYLNAPDYTLLVADMDAETANAVVGRLKADRIPYQLGDGGRTVRVPSDRVDELRLALAADGLPSAGRIGFEIFDRTAFGTTEFLEQVNYRRALEGELARTIATMADVASARVHIAMAKDSLFLDRSEPAKASVALRLKGNRTLSPSAVRGIAALVASSVEGLRPESVTILDHHGRPLTRPEDPAEGTGLDATQLERQQQIERNLAQKVLAMLEPVVGEGRVRVNVAAHLRADIIEETEERWDPNTVVRSRQTTTETGAATVVPAGIAGARANQPPALTTADTANGTAPPVTTTATAPGRSTETTNYEVGKLVRHTLSPQGQLARLSVAVVLDDERVTTKNEDGTVTMATRPWDPEGLQRVQALVAAAVGLDPERGDQLTVENIPFGVVPENAPAPTGFGGRALELLEQHWRTLVNAVVVLLVAAFAFFGVLRPLAAKLGRSVEPPALPAAATAGARLPTVSEMEGQLEAELDAMAAPSPRRLPALTQRVARLAAEEPEQVARIVRGWISEDGR
ncbi:MAG: flagellar basal-body MS-ring/collar protein FliF [Acidobacteriota bacterium]|nr:MAG: flagellar M-ring protein FliF [Acidobacteriota bacterium]